MHINELEELALYACGKTESEVEKAINDSEDIDDIVFEKFGIDLEQFGNVAEALLKLTPVLESPLSKQEHHCFVRKCEGGYIAIARTVSTEK